MEKPHFWPSGRVWLCSVNAEKSKRSMGAELVTKVGLEVKEGAFWAVSGKNLRRKLQKTSGLFPTALASDDGRLARTVGRAGG